MFSISLAMGFGLGFSISSQYAQKKIAKIEAAKKELNTMNQKLATMKGKFEQLDSNLNEKSKAAVTAPKSDLKEKPKAVATAPKPEEAVFTSSVNQPTNLSAFSASGLAIPNPKRGKRRSLLKPEFEQELVNQIAENRKFATAFLARQNAGELDMNDSKNQRDANLCQRALLVSDAMERMIFRMSEPCEEEEDDDPSSDLWDFEEVDEAKADEEWLKVDGRAPAEHGRVGPSV